MSRRPLVALVVFAAFAAGCAQAGRLAETDASSAKTDARPADAHPSIDAAAEGCTSSATCAAAINLGTVSGDTGNAMEDASGYQAAWYVLRVTEDDSGPFGAPMLLQTRLTSPASAMYDLFVYVNTGTDEIDCTTPTGTATTSGTVEATELQWGETGTLANGVDDSRSVSIEVRPKSGATCSAAAPWQLIVTGDT